MVPLSTVSRALRVQTCFPEAEENFFLAKNFFLAENYLLGEKLKLSSSYRKVAM